MVVMGVFAILVGISSINLLTAQRQSLVSSTFSTFISDARSQQVKAMTGDAGTAPDSGSYGIYFTQNSYTLFEGTSYDPNSSTNFVVNLPSSVIFQTINLPNSSIIFNDGDGSVINYSSAQNDVVLSSTTGTETKTITFSDLGTIPQVN